MVSTGLEYTLGAVLGVAVGALGGFAGIGGAPFLVAGLTLILGYDQHLAQGTIVSVMLAPMSLPGCWVMWDRCKVLKWYILSGVLTYAGFSYVGAAVSYLFNSDGMKFLFGILLTLLGGRNVLKAVLDKDPAPAAADAAASNTQKTTDMEDLEVDAVELEPLDDNKDNDDANQVELDDEGMNKNGITVSPDAKYKFSLLTASLMGVVVGTVGGMFGIGAGVLMVPMLTAIWGVHKDDARAISLGILCPPVSLGAVIRYQQEGDIKWPMVALQFTCYVICNYYGAKAGKKVDAKCFNKSLGIMLFFLGIVLVVLSIQSCGGSCF